MYQLVELILTNLDAVGFVLRVIYSMMIMISIPFAAVALLTAIPYRKLWSAAWDFAFDVMWPKVIAPLILPTCLVIALILAAIRFRIASDDGELPHLGAAIQTHFTNAVQ